MSTRGLGTQPVVPRPKSGLQRVGLLTQDRPTLLRILCFVLVLSSGTFGGVAGSFLARAQSTTPAAATLQVTVTNVRSSRGHVRVAVCPRESFLRPTCPWRGSAPSQSGSVVVQVTGIPPGIYAVQSYLDENDDHVINRTLFGIPTEGLGFSNDAAFHFGPPSFNDAAVRLDAAGGAVSLRLRYFD